MPTMAKRNILRGKKPVLKMGPRTQYIPPREQAAEPSYDKEDALAQAKRLFAGHSSYPKRLFGNTRAKEEARTDILMAAVADPEGFQILGEEIARPIEDILDYESWTRKSLHVHPLSKKDFNIVRKGRSIGAHYIGADGDSVCENHDLAISFKPSEFKISSLPCLRNGEQTRENIGDMLDRSQACARSELQLEEDKRTQRLFDACARATGQIIKVKALSTQVLRDAISILDDHGTGADSIHLNRWNLSDIMINMSGDVDPVDHREFLLAGYVGRLDEVKLITAAGTGVEEVIPQNILYVTCRPGLLGELGVRQQTEPSPFNGKPGMLRKWPGPDDRFLNVKTIKGLGDRTWELSFVESQCIFNPHGIVKIVIRPPR